LYQAGEVDYLVATDAVGMGLNMNVDHVAFAGLSKFDGREPRDLRPAEIAQIAGRAGRHARDGTFGTTLDVGPLDPEIIGAVENHMFEPVHRIYWRNGRLDLSSVKSLIRALETPPPHPELVRPRDAEDLASLRALANMPEIAALATGYDAVELLWDVCRVPDFRKTVADLHLRLLSALYRHLMAPAGHLPEAWVGRLVDQLDRTDGDIDTLATRIAHIRTWNYIAHRPSWVEDRPALQERARNIEDRLSDALHERLTQRFVDRQTTLLTRRLKQNEALIAAVKRDGTVVVEGEEVGTLTGFDFLPDDAEAWRTGRALRAAVRQALEPEIRKRAGALATAPAEALLLDPAGTVYWREAPVARLVRGDTLIAPTVLVGAGELVSPSVRQRIEARLTAWLRGHLTTVLAPLHMARDAALTGSARGLMYQVTEALGTVPRAAVADQLEAIDADDRKQLARLGLRLGRETVFLSPMLKPPQMAMRALLWCLHNERTVAVPEPGRVSLSVERDLPDQYYSAIGYRRLGPRALRVDMLERLSAELRKRARKGPFAVDAALLNLAGCSGEDFDGIVRALGYRPAHPDTDKEILYAAPKRRRRPHRPQSDDRKRRQSDARHASSPFAALRALTQPKTGDRT
jgi:ATP-dependent RNA helicase SUPV3L1/SUV3